MAILKWPRLEPSNIYPFQFAVYTTTGFWKIDSKSKWKQFLYKTYHLVNEISYLFIIFGVIVDAYFVRKDVLKLSFNLFTASALVGSIAKIWVFYFKKEQVEKIRAMLDNHLNLPTIGHSEADKKIFEDNSRQVALKAFTFFIIGEHLVFFWATFPIFDKPEEKRIPFPFPPVPITKETPVYELMYAFQVVALFIISLNIVSYDSIFWGFLGRICAHFEILGKNLKKINDLYPKVSYEEIANDYLKRRRKNCHCRGNVKGIDYEVKLEDMLSHRNKEKKRSEQTIKIIKENIIHHRAILRILQDINNIYQAPVLIQISCCAAIIGTAAYGMIVDTKRVDSQFMQRALYTFGALFDSFFYCYYGTQISDRSNRLKEILYGTPWYEMEKSPKKLIIFIIIHLQKPPKVWAFKMFSVDLRTYLQLLKVSYDTLALLKQTSSRSSK